MPNQKIIKVGNSIGITLPSKFVKALSVKPGDIVEVSMDTANTVTLNFIDTHQLSLGLPSTKHRTNKNI